MLLHLISHSYWLNSYGGRMASVHVKGLYHWSQISAFNKLSNWLKAGYDMHRGEFESAPIAQEKQKAKARAFQVSFFCMLSFWKWSNGKFHINSSIFVLIWFSYNFQIEVPQQKKKVDEERLATCYGGAYATPVLTGTTAPAHLDLHRTYIQKSCKQRSAIYLHTSKLQVESKRHGRMSYARATDCYHVSSVPSVASCSPANSSFEVM